MLKLITTVTAVAGSLTAVVFQSRAEIITLEFAGEVSGVIGNAGAHITIGDTFTGYFAYNGDQPPWIAPGRYGLGMQEFSISFTDAGGDNYYNDTQAGDFAAFDIEITDAAFDGFRAVATRMPNPPGDPFASRLQIDFTDQGTDHQGATFDSQDLPAPPPLESLTNRSGSWSLPNFLSVALLDITSASVVEPVAPPEWTAITATDDGEIHLTLKTVDKGQYLVEYSVDGTTWTESQTVTAVGTSTTLTDNPPADAVARIYRATRL